jgi:hypothetical protein
MVRSGRLDCKMMITKAHGHSMVVRLLELKRVCTHELIHPFIDCIRT